MSSKLLTSSPAPSAGEAPTPEASATTMPSWAQGKTLTPPEPKESDEPVTRTKRWTGGFDALGVGQVAVDLPNTIRVRRLGLRQVREPPG